jgi:hypothetical protein
MLIHATAWKGLKTLGQVKAVSHERLHTGHIPHVQNRQIHQGVDQCSPKAEGRDRQWG